MNRPMLRQPLIPDVRSLSPNRAAPPASGEGGGPRLRRSPFLLAFVFCLAPFCVVAQQAPAKPPPVGVVPAMQEADHLVERVCRPHPGDRPGQSRRPRRGFPRPSGPSPKARRSRRASLLYRLEQGPFKADVEAKQAVVAQYKAQLQNADLTLKRAKTLLNTPAGQQSNVDAALANQLSLQAQVLGAEAQLDQSQDQSRLYRHSRADRRQDRPHRGDGRQLCHAELRRARDDRQPGPDVCRLPVSPRARSRR